MVRAADLRAPAWIANAWAAPTAVLPVVVLDAPDGFVWHREQWPNSWERQVREWLPVLQFVDPLVRVVLVDELGEGARREVAAVGVPVLGDGNGGPRRRSCSCAGSRRASEPDEQGPWRARFVGLRCSEPAGGGAGYSSAANCARSAGTFSVYRSRKSRSSRRVRRSQPVISSLPLLALQEPQAGTTFSSV